MPEIRGQSSVRPASEPTPTRETGSPRPPTFGNARGITLLELLVALVIVGILSAVAGKVYAGALERARVARAKAEIRVIEKLIAPRLLDDGNLPLTLDELDWRNLDPWGRPYVYMNFDATDDEDTDENDNLPNDARRDKSTKPLNTRYDLYSTGRDGNSDPSLNAEESWDDVLRAADGVYVGLASKY